jgi:hypothetical protein
LFWILLGYLRDLTKGHILDITDHNVGQQPSTVMVPSGRMHLGFQKGDNRQKMTLYNETYPNISATQTIFGLEDGMGHGKVVYVYNLYL